MALLASLLYCLPYRVWGQDVPKDADKPTTFLLKFGTKEEIEKKEEDMMSEEESAKYAELQKAVWLGIFGMAKDGSKPAPEAQPTPAVPPQQQPAAVPPTKASATPAAPPRPRVRVYTANGH